MGIKTTDPKFKVKTRLRLALAKVQSQDSTTTGHRLAPPTGPGQSSKSRLDPDWLWPKFKVKTRPRLATDWPLRLALAKVQSQDSTPTGSDWLRTTARRSHPRAVTW
jgi:hypothetical protein